MMITIKGRRCAAVLAVLLLTATLGMPVAVAGAPEVGQDQSLDFACSQSETLEAVLLAEGDKVTLSLTNDTGVSLQLSRCQVPEGFSRYFNLSSSLPTELQPGECGKVRVSLHTKPTREIGVQTLEIDCTPMGEQGESAPQPTRMRLYLSVCSCHLICGGLVENQLRISEQQYRELVCVPLQAEVYVAGDCPLEGHGGQAIQTQCSLRGSAGDCAPIAVQDAKSGECYVSVPQPGNYTATIYARAAYCQPVTQTASLAVVKTYDMVSNHQLPALTALEMHPQVVDQQESVQVSVTLDNPSRLPLVEAALCLLGEKSRAEAVGVFEGTDVISIALSIQGDALTAQGNLCSLSGNADMLQSGEYRFSYLRLVVDTGAQNTQAIYTQDEDLGWWVQNSTDYVLGDIAADVGVDAQWTLTDSETGEKRSTFAPAQAGFATQLPQSSGAVSTGSASQSDGAATATQAAQPATGESSAHPSTGDPTDALLPALLAVGALLIAGTGAFILLRSRRKRTDQTK